MAVAAFFFQVQVQEKVSGKRPAHHAVQFPDVIVEVPPSALSTRRALKSSAERAEHDSARSIAEELSNRVIHEKYPEHGPLDFLIAQIGELPGELGKRPPNAQHGGARAWLAQDSAPAVK